MKSSRYTEEQIIGLLREHAVGLSASELCRRHGMSNATFYIWHKKYGGLKVSEAKRLWALGDANCRLKKLLAESLKTQKMDGGHLEE
jgi:putative transposase